HKQPRVIHWITTQYFHGLPLKYFLTKEPMKNQTAIALKKAMKYPVKLFSITLQTALASVAKTFNKRNVVDTGILNLVRIKRIKGADSCKKVKLVGASLKPLEDNL